MAPGYSVEGVRDHLAENLRDVDVYTSRQFSNKTRGYWLINTGARVALLATALMGLVIGSIIVGNTIYASTTEHLKEFGTLKAIGASNWDLYKIIIEQPIWNSVVGYITGMAASYFVVRLMQKGKLEVLLPWQVLAGVYVVTLLMCLGSSVLSIYKETMIDPALVFKS